MKTHTTMHHRRRTDRSPRRLSGTARISILLGLAIGVLMLAVAWPGQASIIDRLLGRNATTCTLPSDIAERAEALQLKAVAQVERDALPASVDAQSAIAPSAEEMRARANDIVLGDVIVQLKEGGAAREIVDQGKAGKPIKNVNTASAVAEVLARYCVNHSMPAGRASAEQEERFGRSRTVLLRSDELATQTPEATRLLVNELKGAEGVQDAYPNYRVYSTFVPNDPYYSSTGAWAQSYRDLWGLQSMRVEGAWDTTQGDSETVVAVIDTGIDSTHPDFYQAGVEPNVETNYAQSNLYVNQGEMGTDGQGRDKRSNNVDDDNNGYYDDWHGMRMMYDFGDHYGYRNDPMDDHGHGTHTAGTIAAVSNNGIGVPGVAPRVKILPIKVLGSDGGGSFWDLENAIIYAGNMGADVINASLGGYVPFNQTVVDDLLSGDAQYVFVASAGNGGIDGCNEYWVILPACANSPIAVGALDPTEQRASFSNWGPRIDVAAPGVDILSLRHRNSDMYGTGRRIVGEKYYRSDGTSMSAPNAAGVVALIRSAAPSLSTATVKSVLRLTARDLGPTGKDNDFGYGVPDAAAAVAAARQLESQPRAELAFLSLTAVSDGTDLTVNGIYHNFGNVWVGSDAIRLYEGNGTNGRVLGNFSLDNGLIHAVVPNVSPSRVTAVLDPDNTILELSETNNILSVPVGDQKAGWPRFDFGYWGTPTLVDLNGDQAQEIVVNAYDGLEPLLRGYYGDGTPVNWAGPVIGSLGAPAIADVDGNGTPEMIVASPEAGREENSYLSAYRTDGSILWQQYMPNQKMVSASPATGDLDGDGNPDIVVAWFPDKVTAFRGTDGSELWTRDLNAYISTNVPIFSSPALGDVNGDGSLDVAIGAADGKVYVLKNTDGSDLNTNWPKQTGSRVNATPALGDLDGDGQLDIVAASYDSKVYAWSGNGNVITGWPQTVNGPIFASPALGDMDGDGQLEVVAATFTGTAYAWRRDGAPLTGWPKEAGGNVTTSPALADLDNDGKLEVIAGSWNNRLHAWKVGGADLDGFPKETQGPVGFSFAVGDIDGDRKLDIVTLNHPWPYEHNLVGWAQFIHVYGVPWTSNDPKPWPTFHQGPLRSGRFGAELPAPPSSPGKPNQPPEDVTP